uniref:Uncharacterized protein n=1 Tax=Heterorhabditis bacteriophora TaxID=37862 RepID=A0A1I7X087_HETBA
MLLSKSVMILTFSSTRYIRQIYRDIDAMGQENDAIMMRFCDENCGYLSFAYGYDANCPDLPLLGSISAEQVKDFKQGLSEVLMDEQFPSKFDRLVKIDAKEPDSKEVIVSLPRKRSIFHSYQTLRLQNDSIHVMDEESVRVNPLTGEKVARVSPPPTTSFTAAFSSLSNISQLKQNSSISSLPNMSNTILSFLQHQFNTSLQSMNGQLFATKIKLSEGFDLGTLLRNVKQQDETEETIKDEQQE